MLDNDNWIQVSKKKSVKLLKIRTEVNKFQNCSTANNFMSKENSLQDFSNDGHHATQDSLKREKVLSGLGLKFPAST
jgi:hypothetical protein